MAFKMLQDTFIYKNLNRNDIITTNIGKLLHDGTVLTKNNIEEALLIINKNFKFPLKYKILEEFASGDIILIYGGNTTKLPTCMPFFLTKKDNRVVAVVSIDTYGTMNKETNYVNIDAKKLYCLMESAYMAKLCFLYNKQVCNRNVVISHGSSIYCNMFTRILNKKYALNVDKNKLQKVLFLSSKFYMLNMLGLQDNDMVVNYAIKNCINGNSLILKEVNDMLNPADYADFSTFITALNKPELNLNFKDLTTRAYLEAFINTFDGSALMALEAFPYFLYNVFAVVNGAYINNQYVLEDIVDIHGAKIYTDLANLER